MKRLVKLAVLASVLLMLIVSCKTTNPSASFTDEQYDYVLHLVLDQAQEQVIADLFKHFNEFKEPMVPEQYSQIDEFRGTAPGLDHLVRQWAESSSLAVLQVFGSFSDYVDQLKGTIVFENPRELLEAGDDSISRYYSSILCDDITQAIFSSIRDMDYSLWIQCVVQYNAWASTRSMLYNESHDILDAETDTDKLATMFSQHLASLFFEHVAAAESLIRTTPDPDMDNVQAQVLGLN